MHGWSLGHSSAEPTYWDMSRWNFVFGLSVPLRRLIPFGRWNQRSCVAHFDAGSLGWFDFSPVFIIRCRIHKLQLGSSCRLMRMCAMCFVQPSFGRRQMFACVMLWAHLIWAIRRARHEFTSDSFGAIILFSYIWVLGIWALIQGSFRYCFYCFGMSWCCIMYPNRLWLLSRFMIASVSCSLCDPCSLPLVFRPLTFTCILWALSFAAWAWNRRLWPCNYIIWGLDFHPLDIRLPVAASDR